MAASFNYSACGIIIQDHGYNKHKKDWESCPKETLLKYIKESVIPNMEKVPVNVSNLHVTADIEDFIKLGCKAKIQADSVSIEIAINLTNMNLEVVHCYPYESKGHNPKYGIGKSVGTNDYHSF
ncbi:hypothetical protein [uncultured Bacteroides sp.]|uniref:hypothetical protein n=1 Tax=uncultured Bacteroides sp. TaxID=162156 RepID=UPI0025EA3EC1|nr:hypothetical protein [uncultured Bacteroides sp.]